MSSNPRIIAAVAGRIALGLAVVAVLAGEPNASAHNPKVSIACQGVGRASVAVLDVDLVSYGNGGHVKATVDGHTLYSRDFAPGDYHASNRVGSGYLDHSVTVAVTAPDDTDGSRGWTRTFDLVTPPCKDRQPAPKRPTAAINGPCEDPQYRGTFHNPTNHPVDGELVWRSGGLLRLWHHSHVNVAAHSTVRTTYKHVLQFTRIRARIDGVTLASERAAKGGWYGKCPK